MADWKKSDIGKIIEYRGDEGIEKVAIYNVYNQVPNEIDTIEYPIELSSRIALLGMVKDQEKKSKEELKYTGDWHFVKRASVEELGVLEKIAKTPKDIVDVI